MLNSTTLVQLACSLLIIGMRLVVIIECFCSTADMIMVELSSEVGIPEARLT